jgi:hypothetical protein
MNMTDIINAGLLMGYGVLEPCCIDGCRTRANNYIVVADDFYELCAFHYTEYLTYYEYQRNLERTKRDFEQAESERSVLERDALLEQEANDG